MTKEARKSVRVEVTVDGTSITLNDFVQNMVSSTVLGMVTSLKGVTEPKEIEIKIKVQPQD